MSLIGSSSKDSNAKDSYRNSKHMVNSSNGKNHQGEKEDGNVNTPMRINAERLFIKRINLHNQIARTMLLRGGAENLISATKDKYIKNTTQHQLKYYIKKLNKLHNDLGSLNSNLICFQNESNIHRSVPMITFGLKVGKPIKFMFAFKDIIRDHYHEDPDLYEDAIETFTKLRENALSATRSEAGLKNLIEYFNQLYFISKRFFRMRKIFNIQFYWFDCLNGEPIIQKSISFEKASILYNIGALLTQLASKQNFVTVNGIYAAIQYYQRAAGAFNMLLENFKNAASFDLSEKMLRIYIKILKAQVQECYYGKIAVTMDSIDIRTKVILCRESAIVGKCYQELFEFMQNDASTKYIPESWRSMSEVKSAIFTAVSHHFAAEVLMHYTTSTKVESTQTFLAVVESMYGEKCPPELWKKNHLLRSALAKFHLTEAINKDKMAMKIRDRCIFLQQMKALQKILIRSHKISVNMISSIWNRNNGSLASVIPPQINGASQNQFQCVHPVFGKSSDRSADLFAALGPLSVFCASAILSNLKTVEIPLTNKTIGFELSNSAPPRIVRVDESKFLVDTLNVDDYIISLNERNVRNLKGPELMQAIEQCDEECVLCVARIVLNPSEFDSPLPQPKRKVGNPVHVTISMEGEEERILHARTVELPAVIKHVAKDEDVENEINAVVNSNNDVENEVTANVEIHISSEEPGQYDQDEVEEMEGGESEELHSLPRDSEQQISEPQVVVEIDLVNDDKESSHIDLHDDKEDIANHISLPRAMIDENSSNLETTVSNDEPINNETTIVSTLQAAKNDCSADLTEDGDNQQNNHEHQFYDNGNEMDENDGLRNEDETEEDGDNLNHNDIKWRTRLDSDIRYEMEIRDNALYEEDNIDDWLFVNEGENEYQEQLNKEKVTNDEVSNNPSILHNDSEVIPENNDKIVQDEETFANQETTSVVRNNISATVAETTTTTIEFSTPEKLNENSSVTTDNAILTRYEISTISPSTSTETSKTIISYSATNDQSTVPMITIESANDDN
ncbi:Rhophilin-2-A [Trichoplax sp. H2]|nr:Rhophilin-2-A [Trichoplax sp. H2]|eukprot:RDD44178.1 Rhophilin-2-A [Trichoplax sp. H2]